MAQLSRSILITRPQNDAVHLQQQLERYHCVCTIMPIYHICAIGFQMPLINPQAYYIFTSRYAVQFFYEQAQALGLNLTHLPCFAIGKSTANALQSMGVKNVIFPDVASSEGLLALSAFEANSLCSKEVYLITGKAGRPKIYATLVERGATVSVVEVYERELNHHSIKNCVDHWQAHPFDAVVLSSTGALQFLGNQLQQMNAIALLQNTPITVCGERMQQLATRLGIKHCYPLDRPENEVILKSLVANLKLRNV